MQTLLTRAGWTITVESLRRYYFDLRKELELSVAEKAHAKKLAEARAAIQKKLIVRESKEIGMAMQDAAIIGKANLAGIAEKTAIRSRAGKSSPAVDQQSKEIHSGQSRLSGDAVRTSSPKPSALTPQPENPQNKLAHGRLGESAIQQNAAEDTISTDREPQLSEGEAEALTLEQIEKISEEKEKDKSYEHPLFAEMLIVKENRVYLESGKPFTGTLLSTQIYLLRKNGRIFPPPPPSRTSKDFVTMPRVL
jgi:hypothetical protein